MLFLVFESRRWIDKLTSLFVELGLVSLPKTNVALTGTSVEDV